MTGSGPASEGLSRQYVKLCEREDFDDPGFRKMLDDILPGLSREDELHRKYWEYSLLGMLLEETGTLRDDAQALAVAAGHEAPLYWLANRIGRIVATDIYGEGTFSSREADASMLTDPASFAPYPYREERLEVRNMNALALDFADDSFDIVFSLSSIEHFGGPGAAARASREMSRVLRPGGILVIATECLIGRHPLDWPPLEFLIRVATLGRRCSQATLRKRAIDAFTPREIERYIIEASGLELLQPLNTDVSEKSYENLTRWSGDGELQPATGVKSPHIMLQAFGAPWTSAFLALRKRP